MSPKTIFIVITVLVIVIAGLFGGAYFISRDTGVPTGDTLQDFLPFGTEPGDIPGVSQTRGVAPAPRVASSVPPPQEEIAKLALRKLSTSPVAGATLDLNDASRVLYVERATGNVFAVVPQTGVVSRITNTTIPGVQEVVWGKGKLVLRYLDENNVVKSFSASLPASTSTSAQAQELRGGFLPDDIDSIVSSPDKTKIFSLRYFGTSILGTVANFDGSGQKQIFDSPHTEWIPEWHDGGSITMTTKASAFVPGFAFLLDTARGTVQKILGGNGGFTTKTSPGGEYVLWSEDEKNSYQTLLFKRKSKISALFPLRTLPEKCMWSSNNSSRVFCAAPVTIPQGDYPDDWYQGVISFSDNLWEVNVENGAVSLLSRLEEQAGEEVDAINPFLNKDESYLFFTNKKDESLWGLRLK